jgi:hypothetical protein
VDFCFRWKSGLGADITAMTGFDPIRTSTSLFDHLGAYEQSFRLLVLPANITKGRTTP